MRDMNAYQVPADPTAVMGKRVAAWLIDFVIIAAIGIVAFLVFAESANVGPFASEVCSLYNAEEDGLKLCFNAGDTVYAASGSDALLIYALPSFYSLLIAGTLIQGISGGTPGKLIMGLRTINRDTGQIAGVGKSFVRTILWIVDSLPCLYLVGIITGFTTSGHRRVGDMAAGTLVVSKDDVGRPPVVAGLTANAPTGYGVAPGAPPAAPTWDAPAAPPAAPADLGSIPEAAPVAEQAPASETATADGPTWDEARNAYIQFDAELNAWVQWDEAAGAWKPIE